MSKCRLAVLAGLSVAMWSGGAEAQVCYTGSSGYRSLGRHAVSFSGYRPVYNRPAYRGASSCSARVVRPAYCPPTYYRPSYYVSPRSGYYTSDGYHVVEPSVVSFSAGRVDRSRVPVVVTEGGVRVAGAGVEEGNASRTPEALEGVRRRSSIVVRPGAAPGTTEQVHDIGDDAWARLAAGDARSALHSFARACREENLPDGDELDLADEKAGYAIAAHALEDEARMIWALRRAVQEDAMGLHYLPVSPEVRGLIESMRDEARERARDGRGDRDDWFVASAASFLLHDHETASEALARAEEAGDESRSAEALRAALDEVARDRDG